MQIHFFVQCNERTLHTPVVTFLAYITRKSHVAIGFWFRVCLCLFSWSWCKGERNSRSLMIRTGAETARSLIRAPMNCSFCSTQCWGRGAEGVAEFRIP